MSRKTARNLNHLPDPERKDRCEDNRMTPTAELLEATRAARIKQDAERTLERKADMASEVDNLINLLRANRDHIAAFAVVVLAYEGDALVDPKTGEASNGDSWRITVNNSYAIQLAHHAKDLTSPSGPMDPLAALLGRR